jgi:hypothetical protein
MFLKRFLDMFRIESASDFSGFPQNPGFDAIPISIAHHHPRAMSEIDLGNRRSEMEKVALMVDRIIMARGARKLNPKSARLLDRSVLPDPARIPARSLGCQRSDQARSDP